MTEGSEPSAFEATYRQQFAFAWRSLRRLGVPERDLADAAQEVFLVVHRKLPEFDYQRPVSTWIYAICLRIASNRRRSAVQRNEILAESDQPFEPTQNVPAAEAARQQQAERRELLEAALAAMPLEQRAVFTLFELEGRTGEEVAVLIGIPQGTVHSRLRLARQVFRRVVQQERADERLEDRRVGGQR